MLLATVVVLAQMLNIQTPRAALSQSAMRAFALGQALNSYCTGADSALPSSAVADAVASLAPVWSHEKAWEVDHPDSSSVRMDVSLHAFWDFQPWQYWHYAIPEGAHLVLMGRCVEPGRMVWQTTRQTTLPRENLPRLLRPAMAALP